jgi:hypothetical protein
MANLLKHADDEQATIHHGLDICPGRLETILASMALFVLRLMRPKIPLDHVRLEWFSACGVQMYADEPRSNDAYGGVMSGTLVLRSKVIEVILGEAERLGYRGLQATASCEGVRGWALLDEKKILPDMRLLAVPILDDVSLLVTKNSDFHTYRRVGLWRIPSAFLYDPLCGPLETWDCPSEYLRWRD